MLKMYKEIIKWDIYEIKTKSTSINGVMLRGKIRKLCLENKRNVLEKKIKIEFNSDINKELNWYFKPTQRSIKTKIGESTLAYYEVKNNGNKSLSGVATYNVLPYEAGKYFNKIDCFCFENQTLDPGEEVLLPVNFYIDTKILEDPAIKHLDTIVLSYTFFQSNENSEKNLENKK